MRKRLIISLILLATLPVVVAMSIALRNQLDTAKEQIVASNLSRLQWGAQYLEEVIMQLDRLFYSIQIQEELFTNLDLLSTGSPAQQMEAFQEVSSSLNASFYANSNKIDKLILLSLDNLHSFTIHHNSPGQIEVLTELSGYWSRLGKATSNIYFEEQEDLYAVHSINDFSTRQAYGGIAVRLDQEIWKTLLSILTPNQAEDVMILNDNFTFLKGSSQDPDVTKELAALNLKDQGNLKEGKVIVQDHHYFFVHEVDETKLILIKSVPISEIIKSTRATLWAGIVILLIFAGLSILLAIVLSNRISQPIIALADKMKKADATSLSFSGAAYIDEIDLLEHGYQEMISRLQNLVKEEYQHELDLKDAKLLALQTQINPHFLNNALNVIGGMALAEENRQIYEVTSSLGKQLRYTLTASHHLVALQEELAHLQHYLTIQAARFEDQCEIDIDMPDALRHLQVPKLILQPIVENAFEHGLQSVSRKWHLLVRGRIIGRRLVIFIADNGKGISKDKLSDLRRGLQEQNRTKRVGLSNVHSRLRLKFGSPSGLKIFSQEGKGTLVSLSMKIKEDDDVHRTYN